MDVKRQVIRLLVGVAALVLILILVSITIDAGATSSITFTVNSPNDNDDGLCDSNHCSLREAINSANLNSGLDTIAFNIPGAGPHTIQPSTKLPEITDPTIIDGYTQPGATPNTNPLEQGLNTVLKIELDGSLLEGASAWWRYCLHVTHGNSTIRGLAVNRCAYGIVLDINGSNTVEGNFIGTDVTGTIAYPNHTGVSIRNHATDNTIGGSTPEASNLISGNSSNGIYIVGVGQTVQGNLIGTDITGFYGLGNNEGINNLLGDNAIVSNNVVAFNDGAGIRIKSNNASVSSNQVWSNGGSGIGVYSAVGYNIISNTIEFNENHGIAIGSTSDSVVKNNIITSNNGAGIRLHEADQIQIMSNYIGTNDNGSGILGNNSHGVHIYSNSSDNVIGGTTEDAGNIIAFNGGDGVYVESGTGNAILANSIYSNNGLGIDLGVDGVNYNDDGDGDEGANNLQNYPILTSVSTDGSIIITGTLENTPNTEFLLDFFANSACDQFSNYGEGETPLSSLTVMTNDLGEVGFTVIFTDTFQEGQQFTATATDPDNNTSEFSECAPLYRVCLPTLYNNYCSDFFDDFSNPASGWEIGDDEYVRYGYVNGQYRVKSKVSGYFYLFSAPTCERENYVIDVDTSWAGQPGSGLGIFFAMTDNFQRYYIFDINTDYQMYRLLHRVPAGWEEIVYPTPSGAINNGNASNHLKVTLDGQRIDLEINGTTVQTVYVSTIGGLTRAGIVSSPYNNQPTSDARFDNFSLVESASDGATSRSNLSNGLSARGADRNRYEPFADNPDWEWRLKE